MIAEKRKLFFSFLSDCYASHKSLLLTTLAVYSILQNADDA